MAVFEIAAESLLDGSKKTFWFDSINSILSETPLVEREEVIAHSFPGKTRDIVRLKIQLGLSCNYSCAYCSQSAVARPPETSRQDIDGFLAKLLPHINPQALRRVEFWGGEPFVYWKTLKPLAERLRDILPPEVQFYVITNGSLLDLEKNEWLERLGFAVSISHDGEAQHVRGEDPFVTNREAIVDLKNRLHPKGRFSINTMLHRGNTSRLAAFAFVDRMFPGDEVPLGELGYVDAYHEGGLEALALTGDEMAEARRNNWAEFRFGGMGINRSHWPGALIETLQTNLREGRKLHELGQKCGMDRQDILAVDLKGNVLTCQNVSAVETAANGRSHKIGTLEDLPAAVPVTATHWSQRPGCRSCPVLALCKGSCMFLQGEHFAASCEMSYSSFIPMFALWFETETGYVPTTIYHPALPPHRQDVWGVVHRLPDKPRRVIPIKSVQAPAAASNGSPIA